jgi:hypothetical protein
MRLKEFKYLQKQTKQELLFSNGVYLAGRKDEEYLIFLYDMETFYVEVYYDPEEDMIGYIRAFTSTDDLAPYVKHVDLRELSIY